MDREAVYAFLHKQIRNIIPTTTAQRFCTDAMQKLFFSEQLKEVYITAEEAVKDGTATKRLLRPPMDTPQATLHAATSKIPQDYLLPPTQSTELNDYVFENGYCFRRFVMDEHKRFIADATRQSLWRSTLYRNSSEIRALPPIRHDVEAIALSTGHTDNYYHCLVDLIGRMLLIPGWENMYIATDLRFPHQEEILSMLGVPRKKIIEITDKGQYQFARLHVISAPADTWVVHRDCYESLKLLRETALPDPDAANRPKRLYISRDDTPGRRNIANESKILPILEEFGFERKFFTRISLKEQYRCLDAVEYLVCPHGAGGASLLFCDPKVRFLEILSPLLSDPSSVYISRALGIEHHILMGENPASTSIQSPYNVNPEHLRAALASLTSH